MQQPSELHIKTPVRQTRKVRFGEVSGETKILAQVCLWGPTLLLCTHCIILPTRRMRRPLPRSSSQSVPWKLTHRSWSRWWEVGAWIHIVGRRKDAHLACGSQLGPWPLHVPGINVKAKMDTIHFWPWCSSIIDSMRLFLALSGQPENPIWSYRGWWKVLSPAAGDRQSGQFRP